MPKVHHVKRARKKNPVADIGESYYWWKFRFGGKRYSKTYPRRSLLTQSDFLSELWDFEDSLTDCVTEDQAEDMISQLEEMRDICECSLDNMPPHLQDTSESGILLTERIEGLDAWIGDISCIDWESTSPEEAAEIINNANPGIG